VGKGVRRDLVWLEEKEGGGGLGGLGRVEVWRRGSGGGGFGLEGGERK